MAKITADEMSNEEYEFWRKRSVQNYANDKMNANKLTEKEAMELSESSFKRLLPDGRKSKDNYLRTVKNEEGKIAGFYWFAVIGAKDNQKAFIYDIVIEEEMRGKGYGRQAMLKLEKEAKVLDLKGIALHVFGFNKTAINLYESLNFEVTDLVMEKQFK